MVSLRFDKLHGSQTRQIIDKIISEQRTEENILKRYQVLIKFKINSAQLGCYFYVRERVSVKGR